MRKRETLSPTVVPALPGYFIVNVYFDNDLLDPTPFIDETPIIAWIVEPRRWIERSYPGVWEAHAMPVTPDDYTPDVYAIKTPQGIYIFPADATVETQAAAVRRFRERQHQHAEFDREVDIGKRLLVAACEAFGIERQRSADGSVRYVPSADDADLRDPEVIVERFRETYPDKAAEIEASIPEIPPLPPEEQITPFGPVSPGGYSPTEEEIQQGNEDAAAAMAERAA